MYIVFEIGLQTLNSFPTEKKAKLFKKFKKNAAVLMKDDKKKRDLYYKIKKVQYFLICIRFQIAFDFPFLFWNQKRQSTMIILKMN